jgi:hypothetical protein
MDTDKNYFAFSEDSIEKLIKPEIRDENEKDQYIFYHQRARNYTLHLMQGITPYN